MYPHRTLCRHVAAIAFSVCLASGAAAKGPFSHTHDRDPNGTIPEAERRVLLDFYNSTGGDSSWDRHDGWNGPPGTECQWYGITCNSRHVIMIELADNNLKGTLPDMSGLRALDYLDLRHNKLSGSVAPIARLASVRFVDIGGNSFSGSLPALSGLRSLVTFRAGSSHLSGEIPPLQGLGNLETFVVDDSALTGPIPSLQGLARLETIDLNDNRLSGPIPSLAGLAALTTIDFSRNQLTGRVPALDGLSKLHSIKLDHNQLKGTMPEAPVPNELVRARSALCPNRLASTRSVQWDRATGSEPWYEACAPATGEDAPAQISAPGKLE